MRSTGSVRNGQKTRRRNRTGKPLTKHEKAPRIIENALLEFQPRNVALWLGDNDVERADDGRPCHEIAEELAYEILAKASALKRKFELEQLFLVQLLPRYFTSKSRSSQSAISRYNSIAHKVNDIFYSEAIPSGCNKHHLGFIFPGEDEDQSRYQAMRSYFLADGVHLNDEGYDKCVKSLPHVAILTAN